MPDHPPPIPLPRSVCWRTCSAGRLPRTRVYWSRRPLTRRWGPVPLWVPAPARPRAVPQALVQRGGPPVHQAQAPVQAAGGPVRTPQALPPADPRAAPLAPLAPLACHVPSTRGRCGAWPQRRARRVPRVPHVASRRTSEHGQERHPRPHPLLVCASLRCSGAGVLGPVYWVLAR